MRLKMQILITYLLTSCITVQLWFDSFKSRIKVTRFTPRVVFDIFLENVIATK